MNENCRERLNHFPFSHSTNQDNSLRPNFGGMPAVVEIDLMVRSMGPVSEVEMVSESNRNGCLSYQSTLRLEILNKYFLQNT